MQKLFKFLIILSAILSCNVNIVFAQYCYPKAVFKPSTYNMYIDRVRLGDIDSQYYNDTCYTDYTQWGPRTLLTRGAAFTMTLNAGPTIYYNSMYYAAWIDYNNDNDFSDAGESLGQYKTTVQNAEFTLSFTVPVGAPIGKVRMRVRCTWSSSALIVDPCLTYNYGEAKDYIVGISDFLKVPTGIPYAGDNNLKFFNMGGDNDYDLIMHDEYSSTVPLRFYTNNGTGTFSLFDYINGDLPDLDNDNLSFNLCDLNNDNALDIMFTYRRTDQTPKTVYFQKSGSLLTQTSTGIADLMWGSSEAADFNNDGRQDIIICGKGTDNLPHTYIYQNTQDGFILVNDKLKPLYGHVAVADYDSDRDIDILLTGSDRYGNTNAILYRNDNNFKFTEIYTNLYKFSYGNKPKFGDFNDDGRLDLICGKVYRNDGNNLFTEILFEEGYDARNSIHWSDIDNDGKLELIGTGDWGTVVYKYNGVDSFLVNIEIIGCEGNDIADVTGDKKPDLFSNEYPNTSIFRNQAASTNNMPTPPTALISSIGDSGFYSVTLRWKSGTDDKTLKSGLTYNLRVGTSSGGNQIFSSMTSAVTNSPLLKPGMGNVFNNTSWFLKDLKPGKYYWNVQTVDHSGLASPFSAEQQFTILAPLTSTSFLVQGKINAGSAGADFNGDSDIDLIIKDSLLTIQNQTALNTYSYVKVRRNSDIIDIKDMNNDNLPDIIARHNKIFNVETKDSLSLFINNGNFTFRVLNLDSISVTSVAAADFDNDGDIDIIAHDRGYYLYECTKKLTYTRSKLPMAEIIYKNSLSAIDIDKDGDFDFIISGRDSNGSSGKCFTFIYKNDGNKNFTFSQSIVPGIGPSTFGATSFIQVTIPADITWNDLNFDGYPDLLLTGDDEYRNNTCQIFLNDRTGQLLLTSLTPRPADKYSPTWTDFNTDGFLDLIMPKIGWTIDNAIYFNDNNNSYYGFANAVDSLTTAMYIKAIDVDQDKDKDILCTYKIPIGVDSYRAETRIYSNTNNFVNQAPNPPTLLTSEIDIFTVNLSWNKGWDKLTGNDGLTYNLWVGTKNDLADIVSPMASLSTGYRFVENIGNVGTNLSWSLKDLPLGKYYWSVQSIDNSMTGSAWAPLGEFELNSLTADFSNDEVCLGFETTFHDQSVSTHPITSWYWDFGDGNYSTVKNPVFRFTKAGNNSVKLVVISAVAKDSIIKNVFVKQVPAAAFTNSIVCAGSPTVFTNTTNANGLVISEWHWDFGDESGSNIQNPGTHGYLIPGSYKAILVAVADNSCSDTTSKIVEIGTIPTAAITSSGSPEFCSGDSIQLTNSYVSTYNYNWQIEGIDITGATNSSFVVKESGSYTVKITNPIGNCTSIAAPVNVTVNDKPASPVINITGSDNFCDGESATLTVDNNPALTYNWKLNGGPVGLDSNKLDVSSTGRYNLVVSNEKKCSVSSYNSIDIVVNSLPVVSAVTPNGATEFCSGGNVTLSVTHNPTHSYSWRNEASLLNETTSSYTAITTGKYQLEVTSTDGCITKTTPVSVTVKPMPSKPSITSSNYTTGQCPPTDVKVKLAAQEVSGHTYQWLKNGVAYPDKTLPYIEENLPQGVYAVETTFNGCKTVSDNFSISYAAAPEIPKVNARGPVVWYLATQFKSYKYYKWYYNDQLISGADKYIYVANKRLGTYRVEVANENLCYTSSADKVIPTTKSDMTDFNIPPEYLISDELDISESIKIYPNPTTGLFTVEMDNDISGELNISIATQNGKEILKIKFTKSSGHFQTQVDLSGQPDGMYIIKLLIDKYSATRKLVVE